MDGGGVIALMGVERGHRRRTFRSPLNFTFISLTPHSHWCYCLSHNLEPTSAIEFSYLVRPVHFAGTYNGSLSSRLQKIVVREGFI